MASLYTCFGHQLLVSHTPCNDISVFSTLPRLPKEILNIPTVTAFGKTLSLQECRTAEMHGDISFAPSAWARVAGPVY